MASHHTGSNDLLEIQTDKVTIVIKGLASPPRLLNRVYGTGDSELKLFCEDDFELTLNGADLRATAMHNGPFLGLYQTKPLFFEQQRYELIIEATDKHDVEFWHDNINIRNKITRVGRRTKMLSGILNFNNEIGLSDLIIRLDGASYLRLVLEVFPTKIGYKEDYQNIVEDVTAEVYSLIFDFLKKTYIGYQQSDKANNSPVEFFAIIKKIYSDLLKAVDLILIKPHHLLESNYDVLPGHKIKRIDGKTKRWIEQHQEQARVVDGRIHVLRAMAVKKKITYDTKENRLAKYILLSTANKLKSFKKNYLRLSRRDDITVSHQIDDMIKGLNRRSDNSLFTNVNSHESSAGMSLVFSLAPGYRALYRYYLMLMRGLSIGGDVFNVSIKDLALLYEYWCFIKLNSFLKERYELVSQDIVRTQGNGIFVSLVKGNDSRVRYKNTHNGEMITLSYNPKKDSLPTISQRPDNVLSLKKKGARTQYEFVFDAKYRINPALRDTDYYRSISQTPGPEVDDINTMHRYRDAIVYQNNASPFERILFGAYVLFPYSNEDEYRQHRFYESIEKVNIGGLPFLPTSVKLVSELLDELISDSPESAFERTILPKGIDDKLAKIDWSVRDVLIGTLRNRNQLETCLNHKFYHAPRSKVSESRFPIRYIALYQSKSLFSADAGIQYYGAVTKCVPIKRNEITEIPSVSNEPYYRFEVLEWKKLSRTITPREVGPRVIEYTNIFLLRHSSDVPELRLRSEEEYRLYSELKRAVNSLTINDDDNEMGFVHKNSLIIFYNGSIDIYRNKKLIAKYGVDEFSRAPNAVFRRIKKELY